MKSVSCVGILLGAAALAGHAEASSIALDPLGISSGFGLTNVISGMPSVAYGTYTLPSVGVNALGQLIAPNSSGGNTYVYPDTSSIYGGFISQTGSGLSGVAMASYAGAVYGSKNYGGYYQFNPDGTIASQSTIAATSLYGLWVNPVNGHLISSSTSGLLDIDYAANSFQIVAPLTGFFADGVTVTPDGQIAYIADYPNDYIRGYALFTGTSALYGAVTYGQEVFNTGLLTGGSTGHNADGMGVLAGSCRQAGQIVVNNNDGTIGLINPTTGVENTIASGGNRGDYASLDSTNGTLILSQDDALVRIAAPAGCTLGTATLTPVDTPEPAGLAIFATALLALWRRAALRLPSRNALCFNYRQNGGPKRC